MQVGCFFNYIKQNSDFHLTLTPHWKNNIPMAVFRAIFYSVAVIMFGVDEEFCSLLKRIEGK